MYLPLRRKSQFTNPISFRPMLFLWWFYFYCRIIQMMKRQISNEPNDNMLYISNHPTKKKNVQKLLSVALSLLSSWFCEWNGWMNMKGRAFVFRIVFFTLYLCKTKWIYILLFIVILAAILLIPPVSARFYKTLSLHVLFYQPRNQIMLTHTLLHIIAM